MGPLNTSNAGASPQGVARFARDSIVGSYNKITAPAALQLGVFDFMAHSSKLGSP